MATREVGGERRVRGILVFLRVEELCKKSLDRGVKRKCLPKNSKIWVGSGSAQQNGRPEHMALFVLIFKKKKSSTKNCLK